jgi:hypothetical protein
VQPLLSLQDAPFVTGGLAQPVVGLQVSEVQALLSTQLSAVPGVHTPARQVSVPLHTVASAQLSPSLTGVEAQPLLGLHVSVVHGFRSSQLSGDAPTHTRVVPLVWQLSVCVQALPSLQGAPTASSVCTQPPPESHESVVQGLLSSQFRPPLPVQTPAWHVSVVPLHALPSLQLVPGG